MGGLQNCGFLCRAQQRSQKGGAQDEPALHGQHLPLLKSWKLCEQSASLFLIEKGAPRLHFCVPFASARARELSRKIGLFLLVNVLDIATRIFVSCASDVFWGSNF